MYGNTRNACADRTSSATSKILKLGFLGMKEPFYVSESDLVKYKWAKMESFFQTPKSVRPTEKPYAARATGTCARLVNFLNLAFWT